MPKPGTIEVTDAPAHDLITGRPGRAYEAAQLRPATIADVPRLLDLWRAAYPDAAEAGSREMMAWLGRGGALTLRNQDGRIQAALRWREEEGGWRIDRVATHPEARGLGYGRWLATKVEALAIRHAVPYLLLELPRSDEQALGYYERMGYRRDADAAEGEAVALRKIVGGVWQRKAP
jgi:ribosomal protein S18 acetylase RimI-like enzyme